MFALVIMLLCRRSKALAAAVSEKAYSTTTATSSSSAKHSRPISSGQRAATTTDPSSGASTAGGQGEHQRLPGMRASLLTPASAASASEDWEEDSLDGQIGRSNGNNRARIVTGFGDYSVS